MKQRKRSPCYNGYSCWCTRTASIFNIMSALFCFLCVNPSDVTAIKSRTSGWRLYTLSKLSYVYIIGIYRKISARTNGFCKDIRNQQTKTLDYWCYRRLYNNTLYTYRCTALTDGLHSLLYVYICVSCCWWQRSALYIGPYYIVSAGRVWIDGRFCWWSRQSRWELVTFSWL